MALNQLVNRLSSEMDATDRVLAESIFGTADPEYIAEQVQSICQAHLGQAIAANEFWDVSVSFTVGLRLANDQRIVLKFRSADNITLETLQAVCQVQQALAAQGFPCPQVLLFPIWNRNCWVTVEQLLNAGENGDAHEPNLRRAMAVGLAQLVQLTKSLTEAHSDVPNLPTSRFQQPQLWQKPHNTLFDFEKTQQGAEWIDAIAADAKQTLLDYHAPLIVGHMDWSAKNMRFQDNQLSAVYDWDSLRLENELVIVGNAAKGFLVTWYVDAGSLVPTPEECQQFVQDYEMARQQITGQQGLSATEREVIRAALVYSIAYTARCEHAVDPHDEMFANSFRVALKNHKSYVF